jgi:hypothetical protein
MRIQAPLVSLDNAIQAAQSMTLDLDLFFEYTHVFKEWTFAIDAGERSHHTEPNPFPVGVSGALNGKWLRLLPIQYLIAVFTFDTHSPQHIACDPLLFALVSEIKTFGAITWIVRVLTLGPQDVYETWTMGKSQLSVPSHWENGQTVSQWQMRWRTSSRHSAVFDKISNHFVAEGQPLAPAEYDITPTRFTPQA